MTAARETTVAVTTRVTRSTVADLDRLAAGLGLTRGNTMTLLLAAALSHRDELLATYVNLRGVRASGDPRGGAPC